MRIGKIVKSDSHINYICHVFQQGDVDAVPSPPDFAFGRFVRIAVRSAQSTAPDRLPGCTAGGDTTFVVGIIYDTILLNPASGSLGSLLSSEVQREAFSPDYISERAVLAYVLVLGMMEQRASLHGETESLSITHGVPLLSLDVGSGVETMTDAEVQAFHFFHDQGASDTAAYLHMGYLPHVNAQRNCLLPLAMLRILAQLERLFPRHHSLLSIVKRSIAWPLKVETIG